ncbi:hypothetical protein JP0145_04020 [Helicobacter pylori]
MENDVKEDLEQARPKQELEKQKQELEKQKQELEKQKQELEKQKQELEKLTQEKEQEIKKKEGRKYTYIFSEIIKEERKYICIIIFLFMLYPILSSITYDEPS